MNTSDLTRAAKAFSIDSSNRRFRLFGAGLIHESWLVDTDHGGRLLQRLNARVFPEPEAMAENAAAAASRVDSALHLLGDDEPRHRLIYLAGPNEKPWFRDDDGAVWRASVQVPRSRPPDASKPAEIRSSARALGRFPGLVADGVGREPREILPNFHDTPARLDALRDLAGSRETERFALCRLECRRLLDLAAIAERLPPGGGLTRWVHNDAKLDNVLVDDETGEALCVVDLDTVMPGRAAHDFGDLVRSAVSGLPEDEADFERISVREDVFRELAAGYVDGSSGWLTAHERSKLVDGAIVITYEQALRFLADFLDGDRYYPVDDKEHNLRRTRAQFRLLEGLLGSEQDLRRIVDQVEPSVVSGTGSD